MDTLQETARVVTSKPVQRAVVNTVLLVCTAVTLLCTAAIASALFFQNFLPHEVVTVPVHLQYGSGINPHGIASLETPPMKSQQEYDVSLTLSMPRSNPNVERGNFMVSLHMLDSKADVQLQAKAEQHAALHDGFGVTNMLFSSRRPALFPYVDPFVSLASRVLFLVYHLFAPSSSTSTMIIPLAERVWFSKGSMIPKSAYVEVEAGQTIQIYHAALQLTAQLRGLRWLMVHYRVSTFLAFTFLFWVCEIVFTGVAWSIWSVATGSSPGDAEAKAGRLEGAWRHGGDDEEETDRPETFPTYGRQQPLKYEPELKQEVDPEQPLSEIPRAGADADDEDEGSFEEGEDDDPQRKDSGIGTSYSEEGSTSIRRRTSRSRMD
ncbi:Seipin like [Fusarium albosuccineum]|uniref:Seipin like n=1 Tax=Fusarium albosuccineum TaxID=1237068 RepID=A0A8H4P0J7_9HYPO|nr:Seipin like [Fusarium albosuccineum]